MEEWKRKLSSRKLWAAIAAAILAVVTVVFGSEMETELAEIAKTGIYSLIAYVFGESAIDAARAFGETTTRGADRDEK